MPIEEVGLYHMTDGKLNALVAVGPLNPREVSDMRATDELVAPIAKATGGGIYWIGKANRRADVPAVRFVGKDRTAAGHDWLGITAQRRLCRDIGRSRRRWCCRRSRSR